MRSQNPFLEEAAKIISEKFSKNLYNLFLNIKFIYLGHPKWT